MYLRETVTASYKDAATVSVKLSMVCGMIVSYIVGGILTDPLLGERPCGAAKALCREPYF